MKEEVGLDMFGSSGYLNNNNNNNNNNNMGNSCMTSSTDLIGMDGDRFLGDQNGVFGSGYNNNGI
ncbi:MAG: hypothetical protein N7Q72_06035, partial [Spiroplasma sp. Tabriz.8]|nr:hypothetical protein [Candidatus Regiella insecticola]MCX2959885.1 hypothetical protein [Serratia symbiotica]MCZ8632805.1 hypothetical protein [Spiroplasma sp. Tabriz.8]